MQSVYFLVILNSLKTANVESVAHKEHTGFRAHHPRKIRNIQLGIAKRLSLEQQKYYPDSDPDKMTYEQLLELEEQIGSVSKGLGIAKIKVSHL